MISFLGAIAAIAGIAGQIHQSRAQSRAEKAARRAERLAFRQEVALVQAEGGGQRSILNQEIARQRIAARSVAPEFIAPSQAQVSMIEPTGLAFATQQQRAPAVALARNPFMPPISSQDRVTQLTNGEITAIEPAAQVGVGEAVGRGALGVGGFFVGGTTQQGIDLARVQVAGGNWPEFMAFPKAVRQTLWDAVRIAWEGIRFGQNDKRVKANVSAWMKSQGVSMATFNKHWPNILILAERERPDVFNATNLILLSNELEKIFKPKRRRRNTSPFTRQAQRMLAAVPRMVKGCKTFVRIAKDVKAKPKKRRAM